MNAALTDGDMEELRQVYASHGAVEGETFEKVIKWLRERDLLDPRDYDEGYSADDIIQALDDHEDGCSTSQANPEALLRQSGSLDVTEAMIEAAKTVLFKRGIVDVFSVRAALLEALSKATQS